MPKSNLNPWKTKSKKIVYKNPWISVREDKVIQPNGKDGIYGVVEVRDGVGIVALDEKHNVYLIGEWRYPIKKYSWSIICGTREGQEKLLTSAKKELLEEANLEASKWKHLLTFHPSPGEVDVTAYIYLAQGLNSAKGVQEGTTKIKVKRVPFKKAFKMIEAGKITDSYAVIGLLKTKDFLKLD